MKLGLFFIVVVLIQGFSAKINGISSNQKKHVEMIEAEEFFMKSSSRIDWSWVRNTWFLSPFALSKRKKNIQIETP